LAQFPYTTLVISDISRRMTLNLMLINQHGIWQSSDFRLTDPATGTLVDDFSAKHVSFRCSDGTALLMYCGAGSVTLPRASPVHLSDWIRQFVRGQSRTLDETLILVRERATADLGSLLLKFNVPHMFNIGAILGEVFWIVQIRNFEISSDLTIGPILSEFQTHAAKVEGSLVSWWPRIISEADQRLMSKVATKRPRKPKEFSDLLAGINLRTSQHAPSVSAHCMTTYLPRSFDGEQTNIHNNGSQNIPFLVPPSLLFGIDLTEVARSQLVRGELAKSDAGLKCAEEILARALQSTLATKNPLKR
jgi:hypothetical protein